MAPKPTYEIASPPVVARCADWLVQREPKSGARVVGISGAQGSGKSTLSERLVRELGRRGLPSVVLSLDDFYLPKADRVRLAQEEHSLFATRGVPKTHEVERLADALTTLREGRSAVVPVFDKASDDRLPVEQWRTIPASAYSFVFVEGWCLGVPPQPERDLRAPINDLEARQDADGRWRRAVNDALAGEYRALFATFDLLLLVLAPSFEVVFRWRAEQEAALKEADPRSTTMERAELEWFIRHFERLTRHSLETLPRRADLVLELDSSRRVTGFVEH